MLNRFKKSRNASKAATDASQTESSLKVMKLPNKDNKLEDKIAQARGSTGVFQYVSVTGFSKETKAKRIARLLSSRPIMASVEHEISDLPVINLSERKEKFLLKDCIGTKVLRDCKQYIHLEEVRIQLTATQGFYTPYSEIVIGIRDGRLAEDNIVRSSTVETNKPSLNMFSLDYCFHKRDINEMSLIIECLNSPLLPGMVWASCQIQLKLQFSDAARPVQLEPTLAVLEMPQSSMAKPATNPYHANLAMDNDDMDAIRSLFKVGRIIDKSAPIGKPLKTGFGGSEAGDNEDVGKEPGPSRLDTYIRDQAVADIPEDDAVDAQSSTESERIKAAEAKYNSQRNSKIDRKGKSTGNRPRFTE